MAADAISTPPCCAEMTEPVGIALPSPVCTAPEMEPAAASPPPSEVVPVVVSISLSLGRSR